MSRPFDEPGPWDWLYVELADAWRAAQNEATRAYYHWFATSDRTGFAVYRAAQDRADAAQDELAGHWATG